MCKIFRIPYISQTSKNVIFLENEDFSYLPGKNKEDENSMRIVYYIYTVSCVYLYESLHLPYFTWKNDSV